MQVSIKLIGIFVASATTLCGMVPTANASTILTFSGVASTGDFNGTPFTNKPFSLAFEVNSSASPTWNSPANAVIGGSITINNQTLPLVGASASGIVSVNVSSGGSDIGDAVSINPSSGGFIQFIVANNALFPSNYSGTTLGAMHGLSAANTTTDPYNNGPAVSFQPSFGGAIAEGGPTSASSLLTSAGPINMAGFASGPNLRNGLWSFGAASSNVPEPTSMMAIAGMSSLMISRKRR